MATMYSAPLKDSDEHFEVKVMVRRRDGKDLTADDLEALRAKYPATGDRPAHPEIARETRAIAAENAAHESTKAPSARKPTAKRAKKAAAAKRRARG